MNTKEILIRAKERITDPVKWTQGEYARDKEGVSMATTNPNAVCWCAYGALLAETSVSDRNMEALGVFRRAIKTDNIEEWNDMGIIRSHQEVLKAFDMAIRRAS